MKVAPSIIAADFSQFQEEILAVEHAGADMLHLDIMDGVFVPNLTFGPMIIEAINRITSMLLWSHLMIIEPEKYLKQYISAGSDWISFHLEATKHISSSLDLLKEHGVTSGLSINPETAFSKVIPYLDRINVLLIMTVNPGFYGQKFMKEVLSKIKEARSYIEQHDLDCSIAVDGGVSKGNIRLLQDAGTDIVVAGASVFKAADYAQAIQELKCSKD